MDKVWRGKIEAHSMHLNFQNTRFYSVCAVLVTNDWTEIRFEIKDDHGSEHLKKFNKKFAPHFIYSFILQTKFSSQTLWMTVWNEMRWNELNLNSEIHHSYSPNSHLSTLLRSTPPYTNTYAHGAHLSSSAMRGCVWNWMSTWRHKHRIHNKKPTTTQKSNLVALVPLTNIIEIFAHFNSTFHWMLRLWYLSWTKD